MLKPNKYLKEIGIDENFWLFKDAKSGDKRFLPDEEGFVPAEFWNLDGTFAMYIYSHLCYYRDYCNINHPEGFSQEQWDKCLNNMIYSFRLLVEKDKIISYKSNSIEESKDKEEKIKYGLQLFVKYFSCFWY